MSIEAVSWAFKQRLDDPTAKLVLLGIADKYNEDRGYAWPSVQRLAEMADCTERTVNRKISLLADVGLIQILHNPPQTNRYYLPTLTSCHPDTSGQINPDTVGNLTLTPDVRQTIDNNNINNKDMINSFELFWKEVPKKVGKKSAMRAYKTALKDVESDTLLKQIKAYSERVRVEGTQQQYILHPTTWLNQGRWDDEVAKPDEINDSFGVGRRWMPANKDEFRSKVLGTMRGYYQAHRPDIFQEAKKQGWI